MRNRTLGILIGAAAVLLAVFIYLIVILSGKKPAESGSKSSATASTTATTMTAPTVTSTSSAPKYILGEWEGKLALFIPPSTSPDRVYDVYVSSLPETEQTKLAAGIAIYDDQTLSGLIEDYTS